MKKLTQKEIEREREQADAAWNYVKTLYLSDYPAFETSIRIVSEMAEKVLPRNLAPYALLVIHAAMLQLNAEYAEQRGHDIQMKDIWSKS